jgi:FkbM family methyltransferase
MPGRSSAISCRRCRRRSQTAAASGRSSRRRSISRHAQQTIALNHLDNVDLCLAGLGERARTRQLLVKGPSGVDLGGDSGFLPDLADAAPGRTVAAEIVRIDDAVPSRRRVGVLHLDVQGYELKALRGAVRTIRRWRPLVVLEQNPAISRCAQLLSRFDYRVAGMLDANLVFRPAEMRVTLAGSA